LSAPSVPLSAPAGQSDGSGKSGRACCRRSVPGYRDPGFPDFSQRGCRPELLKGEGTQAAALRGVLLTCAVLLAKAEEIGQKAQEAVWDIIRRALGHLAVPRLLHAKHTVDALHQTAGPVSLLDLKRLHWNCHTFRTGRRGSTTPYERLGMPWPEGLRLVGCAQTNT
jgi:hypothetical protein